MAVVPDGRPSTTGYRVRERFAGWTLLELDLVTGRTHQIRVHLDAIGHPVAGDPVYGTGTSRRGPDGLERLFLHAWRLEFAAPGDGHLIRADAPICPPSSQTCSMGCAPPRWPGDRRAARPTVQRAVDVPGHVSDDPGRPDCVIEGAPGAMLVIISGPSGVGKDTIIDVMRRAVAVRPDGERHYVVTVHDARAAGRRGRRRRLPLRLARRVPADPRRPAASSRRTRSTATGTARRATRSVEPR